MAASIVDIRPRELQKSQEDAQLDEQPSVLHKLQKWGDYEAFGDPVSPTLFVPMKTPLGSDIIQNWSLPEPPVHPLTLESLRRAQSEQGRQLGMIIDLSNHETLYEADLERTDLLYEHIPLIAKVFPTKEAVNRVIQVADEYWSQNPHQHIAIHCAYGFNRTGFVVCSYLVQARNLSVQEALDSFAAARPPGVRHDKFVAELHRRYDGWKRSEPIAITPSLSDLRGYAMKPEHGSTRQSVGSLHSDFMGVAEHLADSHPGCASRLSDTFGDDSNRGAAQPCDPSRITREDSSDAGSPRQLRRFAALRDPQYGSNMSLDANMSGCESVNNESLDLDEREIFKHFAQREATGNALPESSNGYHRRGSHPFKPASAPPLTLERIRQSEDSLSSRSPFAESSVQDSAEQASDETAFERSQRAEALRDAAKSGQGEQSNRQQSAGHTDCATETSRGVLRRGPVTERRIVEKHNSRLHWPCSLM